MAEEADDDCFDPDIEALPSESFSSLEYSIRTDRDSNAVKTSETMQSIAFRSDEKNVTSASTSPQKSFDQGAVEHPSSDYGFDDEDVIDLDNHGLLFQSPSVKPAFQPTALRADVGDRVDTLRATQAQPGPTGPSTLVYNLASRPAWKNTQQAADTSGDGAAYSQRKQDYTHERQQERQVPLTRKPSASGLEARIREVCLISARYSGITRSELTALA